MNNDLMKKRYELYKELHMIEINLNDLEKIMKSEKIFLEPESIIALDKIKKYITNTKNRKQQVCDELGVVEKEIRDTCKHELLKTNYDQCICMLCNKWFFANKVNFEHILLENMEYDSHEINNILKEIIYSDEQILDTFIERTSQKELHKVRIYRR